jgi:hypothetical protein
MNDRIISLAQKYALLLPLLLAAVVRAAMWGGVPRTRLISDEGEYLSAAAWLILGRGFDWYQGYFWTRAPLYPLFVAAHLRLFGDSQLPIYVSQMLLSLLAVALVYWLGIRLVPRNRSMAVLAACAMAIYLPFVIYPQVVLSETLFILLVLAAFSLLIDAAHHPRTAALAGLLLGLTTLTRSLTLGFLPFVIIWMLRERSSVKGLPPHKHYLPVAALLLALGLMIAPWTIYNSRLYGGLVLVDTSGAFNLLLGARTAYDGRRSDAQVRDYALGLLGQTTSSPVDDSCLAFPGALPSQAARQAAMTREGLCLIAAKPLAFAEKSILELIDLFQINYTGAERFTSGFSTGRLDPTYVLALFVLDDLLYVLALPLAVVGWAIARTRSDSPLITLTGLWWGYNLFVAPLLFAINRFRLPLMPFVFLFAAYAILAFLQRKPHAPLVNAVSPDTRGKRLFLYLAGICAALVFLIAATPYAYGEPRAAGEDSRWASLLGPYPSSLENTRIALAARPIYLNDLQFAEALQMGDTNRAEQLLRSEALGAELRRLGPALIAARQGMYEQALVLLPPAVLIEQNRDTNAAVLRGDLLRSLGDPAAALPILSARHVDDLNPLDWAWQWLQPTPTNRINVGGSLDIGYVVGCYPSEGDTTITPAANFRWCSNSAQLRFPQAATGVSQTLVLRADGRAWQVQGQIPTFRIMMAGEIVGSFVLDTSGVAEYTIELPAQPPGSEVLITLHGPTFVPDAARYNSQQGRLVVGQVQYLGLRLDWAELR